MATKRIGVVLLIALLAGGCGAVKESTKTETAGSARSLPGLTPEKLEKIRKWSIKAAAEMGEDHPTDGIILATTRHHFYELTKGPSGGADFDAFIAAYKGDFTANNTSRPMGAAAPTGHDVYVIYRADSLELSDWGVGDNAFDPGKIGPWMPLDLDH